MKIFIDPQYGGTFYGGRVVTEDGTTVFGKDITWQISMFLKEMIERTTYNQVFLSRQGDECISLERKEAFEGIERALLCNKYHCNIAISIGVRWNTRRKEDRGSSILYSRVLTTRSKQLATYLWNHTKKQVKIPNRVFVGGHSYFLMVCKCDAVEYKPVTLSNPIDFEYINNIDNQYHVAKVIYDTLKDFYGLRFRLKGDIII